MTTERSTPPRTVRSASALLVVSALLGSAAAGTAFAGLAHLRTAGPVLKRALLAAPDSTVDVHALIRGVREPLHLDAGTGLLGLALLVVAAWSIRRPRRVGRWVAWVSVALLVPLLGIALASGSLYPSSSSAPGPVAGAIDGLTPGWYPYVNTLVVVAEAAALVAIIVLLARTESAVFFARRRESDVAGMYTFVRRDQP